MFGNSLHFIPNWLTPQSLISNLSKAPLPSQKGYSHIPSSCSFIRSTTLFMSHAPAPHLQSYKHMSKHLSVFGFSADSPLTSLLQCSKELLDNAFEATRTSPSPQISLRLTGSASVYWLEVTDNGCGINDLNFTEALNCFSSTRDAKSPPSGSAKFGRFGCGLSASVLYSLSTTKQLVRIVSKVPGNELIRIADLSFDSLTGQAVVTQQQEINCNDMPSGTKIRLAFSSCRYIHLLSNAIRELMCRYLLTNLEVHITPGVPLLASLFLQPSEPVVAFALHSTYSAATSTLYCLKKENLLTKDNEFHCESIVDAGHVRSSVTATLIVREVDPTARPTASPTYVDLLRCANSTPLLDYLDEGLSCVVTRALRRASWNRVGCQLKANTPCDLRLSLLNNPKWELVVWSREYKDATRVIDRLIIEVNVCGPELPFSSLRKMAIGESNDIFISTLQGINDVLIELQLTHPDLFVSKEIAKENKFSKFAPIVAVSIARIIKFAPIDALKVLGLPATSMNEELIGCAIQERIADAGGRYFGDGEDHLEAGDSNI